MTGVTEPRAAAAVAYDGAPVDALRARWGLPQLEVHASLPSTMDRAHALAAAGAPDGTVVLADVQAAGRGRTGGRWHSAPGGAVLVTLLLRLGDPLAVGVLSLRVGLAVAAALEPLARSSLRLKWPNDVHDATGKLVGILCEARWRGAQPDWVAVGIGVNVEAPGPEAPVTAAALAPGATRLAVLDALLPAVRAAGAPSGPLDDAERQAWAARDLLRGRRIRTPALGTVTGIGAQGELLVEGPEGVQSCHTGSITFAEA
jgi:BirA family transcriptional regulator, biotin operon repressor / biotin---[acetyl-CoA-carboxylase] ligase